MSTMTLTKARTYSQEEADQLLYGNQPYDKSRFAATETFNNAYDTSGFDEMLKKDEYVGNEFISSIATSGYATPSSAPTVPFSASAADILSQPSGLGLEKYIAPGSTPHVEPRQSYAPFKPFVIDELNNEIGLFDTQIAQPIKIAEVDMEVEHEVAIKPAPLKKNYSDAVIKLNHKGMIAVGAFFAILLLVTVLVIINAVSLGSSSARLSSLRAETSTASSQLSQMQAERDLAYSQRTADINSQLNQNGTVQMGNGSYRQFDFNGSHSIRVPGQQRWRESDNPDASSNWFDSMSRWLSGLFR